MLGCELKQFRFGNVLWQRGWQDSWG